MLRVRTVCLVAVALIAGGFFLARMLVAQDHSDPNRRVFREGSSGMTKTALLKNSDVQSDLHLTDDQKTALQKFAEQMHTEVQTLLASLKGLHDMPQDERRAKVAEVLPKVEEDENAIRHKFEEVLNTDQQERLSQIELQAELQTYPWIVFSKQEVIDNLQLTEDQKKNLEDLRKNMRGRGGFVFGGRGFGGPGGPRGTGGPGGPAPGQAAGVPGASATGPSSFAEARKKSNQETLTKCKEILTPDQRDKLDKMQGAKFDGDLGEIMMGGPGGGRGTRGGRSGRKNRDGQNANAKPSGATASSTPSTTSKSPASSAATPAAAPPVVAPQSK